MFPPDNSEPKILFTKGDMAKLPRFVKKVNADGSKEDAKEQPAYIDRPAKAQISIVGSRLTRRPEALQR